MRHTRVIVTHYGGPDALRVVEEECPEPKNGEVRVRVLAAGVSLPDLLMREGVHPETPPVPFTPGWDLIGVVDRLGTGTSGIEPGQIFAALPISGAYAEFVCLPQRELVPVPSGLDAAEAVSLVLNYVTGYQMLHRSATVRSGQRVLIHGAAGGVGSALLQLGRLAGLEMYGTCSSRGASAVSDLGAIPIDYQQQDFVKEIRRLTSEGVDVVFDGIGGTHIWRSRKALRLGGRVEFVLARKFQIDKDILLQRIPSAILYTAAVKLLRSAVTVLNLDEVQVRVVERCEESLHRQLMTKHHYLGYLPKIGQTLWYVATYEDQWIALLTFSAAAWSVPCAISGSAGIFIISMTMTD